MTLRIVFLIRVLVKLFNCFFFQIFIFIILVNGTVGIVLAKILELYCSELKKFCAKCFGVSLLKSG